MDPGLRGPPGCDLIVRHEGDPTTTSPGVPVRQPSRPEGGSASTVVVEHKTVTTYVATVRGHEVRVDQPLAAAVVVGTRMEFARAEVHGWPLGSGPSTLARPTQASTA